MLEITVFMFVLIVDVHKALCERCQAFTCSSIAL